MQAKFENHIAQNFPFLIGKRLLLASSGGIDSMVMVELFHRLAFDIAIIHSNFQLRGEESHQDQKFIEDYAHSKGIKLFVSQFDTKSFATSYKLSTQVAARELRYHWFYEVLETENYDYILTAHQADDNLETFLIHLMRGTGIDGLTGIPAQNNKIIRPLLAFSRLEIEQYAQENKIDWREDSSNNSDVYLRNQIRHHLVPEFKKLNPNFLSAFQKTQSHLLESKIMAQEASNIVYEQIAKEKGTEIHFDLKKIKNLPNYKIYLYHWLNKYGFSAWEDIYDLIDSQSGKQIFSNKFRLLKDRNSIIVSPINLEEYNEIYFINKNQKELLSPIPILFTKVKEQSISSNLTIFADEDKLWYPLILRRWKKGDSFQPLGMGGKSKKLSKFFKDKKMSLIEKEKVWLLCSGDEIIWVVGMRQDERFKVKNTSRNILKIDLKYV